MEFTELCGWREEHFFKGSALLRPYLTQGPTYCLYWVGLVWVSGGGSLLFDPVESEVVAGF